MFSTSLSFTAPYIICNFDNVLFYKVAFYFSYPIFIMSHIYNYFRVLLLSIATALINGVFANIGKSQLYRFVFISKYYFLVCNSVSLLMLLFVCFFRFGSIQIATNIYRHIAHLCILQIKSTGRSADLICVMLSSANSKCALVYLLLFV